MDQATMQARAEAHGQAVVDGDMDRVIADIVEELHPNVGQVAALLPQPVTAADVVECQVDGDHAIVQIRYSNDNQAVTLRSRWEERDGDAMIVDVAPAG